MTIGNNSSEGTRVGTYVGLAAADAMPAVIGNVFGPGKKKNTTVVTKTTTNENPGTFGSVTGAQYTNYNDAMNALNQYNQTNPDTYADWSNYGSSQEGYNKTTKKGWFGGSSSSKSPWYKVGYNTGYSPLDDYTNNALSTTWSDYNTNMNDLYGQKLDSLTGAIKDDYSDSLYDQYGLGNAASAVNSADAQQKAEAQQLLANIYAGGNINKDAYTSSMKNIDKQSIANKKNLYDLADAQTTTWQDLMSEAIAADKDAQNDEGDWIKNYALWNKYGTGTDADAILGDDIKDRMAAYYNNNVSDDYYNSLLNGTSTYLPYTAISDSYATGDATADSIDPLQSWSDLLLSGKKRKANLDNQVTGE